MPDVVSVIKTVLDLFLKLKDAFSELKKSDLFLGETDINDLVEKYFAFEQLPKGSISLIGKLSDFTVTNNLPVYSPIRSTATKQEMGEKLYDFKTKQFRHEYKVHTQMNALSIPAIRYNTVSLEDTSNARILWLYNEENKGLLLTLKGNKLDANDIINTFDIQDSNRPIPVLVDPKTSINQYLYRRVKLKGKIVTASLKSFQALEGILNPFLTNYFGNCFRPFSNGEGVLAIDLRDESARIEDLENSADSFPIVYTVQGIVEIGIEKEDQFKWDIVQKLCTDCIPDRQGMGPLTSMGHNSHPVYTILSIGEVNWQVIQKPLTLAAYIEMDASDPSDYQAKIAKLAYHWQGWQKNARAAIRKHFNLEPKISPLICSNRNNENSFHPNGLQIPTELERILFDQNPELRRSIDWLGISTGRK